MNSLTRGQAVKGLAQINIVALIVNHRRTINFLSDMTQDRFREIHLILVRPIRRIEFHHREFRIVTNGQTFVAEVAV